MPVDQLTGPVYIAGPMTGIPEYNLPAFNLAETLIRAQYPGIEIENPAHNVSNGGSAGSQPYSFYFRLGLQQLIQCKTIILLPGFQQSKGAAMEYDIAVMLDMEAYAYADNGPESNEFFLVKV